MTKIHEKIVCNRYLDNTFYSLPLTCLKIFVQYFIFNHTLQNILCIVFGGFSVDMLVLDLLSHFLKKAGFFKIMGFVNSIESSLASTILPPLNSFDRGGGTSWDGWDTCPTYLCYWWFKQIFGNSSAFIDLLFCHFCLIRWFNVRFISYLKCSNWRQISKLLLNFGCLFTCLGKFNQT